MLKPAHLGSRARLGTFYKLARVPRLASRKLSAARERRSAGLDAANNKENVIYLSQLTAVIKHYSCQSQLSIVIFV